MSKRAKLTYTGYVYIVKMVYPPLSGTASSLVKFGFANTEAEITTAIEGWQQGNPFELQKIVHFGINDWSKIEKAIQLKYRNRRVRDKWFNLTHLDISDLVEDLRGN